MLVNIALKRTPSVMDAITRWKNVDLAAVSRDVANIHIRNSCVGLDDASIQVVLDNVLGPSTSRRPVLALVSNDFSPQPEVKVNAIFEIFADGLKIGIAVAKDAEAALNAARSATTRKTVSKMDISCDYDSIRVQPLGGIRLVI